MNQLGGTEVVTGSSGREATPEEEHQQMSRSNEAVSNQISDDYLQKKARGYTVPESFNHGTSAQRQRWLQKGATTGDIRQGDTFSPAYNQL